MEVTAVGAVHYIVITFQVGTREMKERPKVGKVPQAGEQESVMEYWWRWCSGTVPTSRQSKDANAVEISTFAFYQQKSQWHLKADRSIYLYPG